MLGKLQVHSGGLLWTNIVPKDSQVLLTHMQGQKSEDFVVNAVEEACMRLLGNDSKAVFLASAKQLDSWLA